MRLGGAVVAALISLWTSAVAAQQLDFKRVSRSGDELLSYRWKDSAKHDYTAAFTLTRDAIKEAEASFHDFSMDAMWRTLEADLRDEVEKFGNGARIDLKRNIDGLHWTLKARDQKEADLLSQKVSGRLERAQQAYLKTYLRRMVGERVYRSFWPKALYNLDAEDAANMTIVGQTDHGETVQIQKRAAESDLIVYVNINLVAMDGGHKSVAVGLAGYESLKHHHNVNTMLHSQSYMDPREGHSAINDSVNRMGRLLKDNGVKIFQIETTMNADTFPSQLGFLNKREWEWSAKDQALMAGAKQANDLAPPRIRREFFRRIEAPYKVTGVNAGEVEAVHERTIENLHRQQLVEVQGQADIAIFGIPYIGPYNVNSVLNPILVHCLGLGYLFNMYRNKPIVREGGVAILFHPVPWEFNTIHHPSYIDFFEEVLAETTDPKQIEATFEERYARDPWYIHLYRTSHAYHGVHPFYMWYWGAHGRDHCGDVIFVGGEPKSVARLGYRRADSLRDAMEMAKDTVGSGASITYFHAPPIMIADVQ